MRSINNRRILVVDDEKRVRDLFLMVISMRIKDARVDVAINGLEAFEMFKEGRHIAVIMDLVMPVMNGIQTFEAVRDYCIGAGQAMPVVVFCTGHGSCGKLESLVESDARHCIMIKPFKNSDLVSIIRQRIEYVEHLAEEGRT